MSILVAAALAASASSAPSCSWDHPGVDPFMGNVVAAVDRYSDIPAPVRAALKQRMAVRQYDDLAVIRRDNIAGKHLYSPELREMHFGQGQICGTVTRARWQPDHEERGLVYCESGHCIIVPTVCRNVSRVTRLPQAPLSTASALPEGGAGGTQGAQTPGDELSFDPPGAGPTFAEQADPDSPSRRLAAVDRPAASAGGLAGGEGTALPGGGSASDAPGFFETGGENGDGWITNPTSPTNPNDGADSQPISAGPQFPAIGGGGRRPGGSAFPFDPGPLVLPLAPPPVPEPGTWALWFVGLVALAARAGHASRKRAFSSCE